MKLLSSVSIDHIEVVSKVDKLAFIKEKSNNVSGQEDYDDAFYVCDIGDIVAKYQRWYKAFPRITPHYAVKCNPDPVLLKTLLALGTGFDCASKGEIREMLFLGAQSDQIIFANPCKQVSHIRYAHSSDVKLVVFDSKEELLKMKSIFPTAKLVLRIETDDSTSLMPFSLKFGADMNSSRHLLDVASEIGLNVVGISFHVGSRCQEAGVFVQALKHARTLFDYAESVGYKFNLLDIGGGFPGSDDTVLKFEDIALEVNFHIEKFFPADKFAHLRVIAEPGRYFSASAFTLTTNIIAKKKVPHHLLENSAPDEKGLLDSKICAKSEEPTFKYYINDGLYGSFNCILYDCAMPLPVVLNAHAAGDTKFKSSIWGPTCDGLDRIVKEMLLPELDVSDCLVWHDMGAYTIAAGCSFNGFKVSKVYYTISESDLALLRSLVEDLDSLGVGFTWIGCNNNNADLRDKAAAKKLALLQNFKETGANVKVETLPTAT